jgi:PAS domain S-box-containing protein
MKKPPKKAAKKKAVKKAPKKTAKKPRKSTSLRREAEKRLEKQTGRLETLSTSDMKSLVHEIGTHQIELEIQNEKLRNAQEELEASHRKYTDLYDFAPIGYFTFNKDGIILEANLTAALMLGVNKRLLLDQPFSRFIAEAGDREKFFLHVSSIVKGQIKDTCELRIKGKGDTKFYAGLQSIAAESERGAIHIRAAMSDITERRRAEKALAESERKFFLLFQKAGFGVVLETSPDGVFVDVNEAAVKMLGWPREEVIGKTSRDLRLHPDPAVRAQIFQELGGHRGIRDREVKMRTKSGEARLFLLNIIPMEFGGREYQVVTLVDITERKRAEEALRASRSRLEAVFAAVPNPIIEFDAGGNPIMANEAALKALGTDSLNFTRAQAVAKLKFENVDGSASTIEDLPVSRALRGNAVAGDLYRIRTADGIWRVISTYATPLAEEKGRIGGAVALWHDITELKQAEEALRRSEEQFRLAIENAPIPVIMHAEDGEVLQISRTWTELTGYTIADIRTFDEWTTNVVYGEGADEVRNYLRDLFRSNRNRKKLEFAIRTADGNVRYWSFSASVPGMLADGRRYIVGMAEDITERNNAEAAVKAANAQLELKMIELAALNKELEAFNYSVSHDLRAPLRHIDGFVHALLDGYADKLDEKGRDYLRRVGAGAQRMKDLIDALLSLSRYTRVNVNRSKVYLSSMVQAAVAEQRLSWPERNVEVVVADGVTVEGDPAMLQVVINNLVWNSWKFTQSRPDAKIEFGAFECGARNAEFGMKTQGMCKEGETVYFVRDNGVGFDKKYSDKLFKPFLRLHFEDEFPGLGIGLSIVQRIIHRHGGRIWAEGEVDKGATFYFTLK